MIFTDILNELRAIRIGLEIQLRRQGNDVSLIGMAQDITSAKAFDASLVRRPRALKTPSSLLHRNDQYLEAQDALEAGGDDTALILEEVERQMGKEQADSLREFYHAEIMRRNANQTR